MQKYNNYEIVAKYMGQTALSAVYYGLHLVWVAVRSCFGSGTWVGNKPWLNKETWKV